jgi:hypothetical protein
LGFKLEKEGRLLPDFAAFAEAADTSTVTVDLAVRWAATPEGASPVWAAQRLSMVRGFARYLQTVDPATQVPPADLLPARTSHVTPYIYSDADIDALMTTARKLRNPVKAATFETLIALLAVTGLRGSPLMARRGCRRCGGVRANAEEGWDSRCRSLLIGGVGDGHRPGHGWHRASGSRAGGPAETGAPGAGAGPLAAARPGGAVDQG